MWKPTDLGPEIARRELVLRVGAHKRVVVLRIGCPIKAPKGRRHGPWFCPIRFDGLGPVGKVFSVAGEDSLQALVLALDFARRMLPHYAQGEGGTLAWVSKDLDVVSPQRDLVEFYSQASAEALNGVRIAEVALRKTKSPQLRPVHKHLAGLVRKYEEHKATGRRRNSK